MSIMNISSYKNNNRVRISPIQFIGNNHPYKLFYIVNLCISSSLFISNYNFTYINTLIINI